ncbi:hypothetical protein DPMN_024118 [Dreissena polymorpha]|nr:hypothetical protein DPMN_024118 [Dreissena polymorpha]
MIKACVTDQVLDAAANRTNDESIDEKRVSSGRTSRLLQLTESYSKLSTGLKEFEAERSDIEGLNKNDLAKLINERKKQKSELEEKFIRLHENLLRLKRDYDYSKRFLPVKRYGFLKDMVKPVIRNERLKETYTA